VALPIGDCGVWSA